MPCEPLSHIGGHSAGPADVLLANVVSMGGLLGSWWIEANGKGGSTCFFTSLTAALVTGSMCIASFSPDSLHADGESTRI